MKIKTPKLTHERLLQVLTYFPETGDFIWNVRMSSRALANTKAGSMALGYVLIRIDREAIRAHRMAHFYITGQWPRGEIDHINCIRNDNRWANIREVSRTMNMQNRKDKKRHNTSGALGVVLRKWRSSTPYQAQITVNKKRIPLGRFSTLEEAREAYLTAKRNMHEGCTI